MTTFTEAQRPSMALGEPMTRVDDLEVIREALALIDRGLGDLHHRELVSTDEVADLLLDVRTLLAPADAGDADDEPLVPSA
ncbi:MAG TPA: hypothetical protein VF640_04145 [Acidimicrobiales bacterium]